MRDTWSVIEATGPGGAWRLAVDRGAPLARLPRNRANNRWIVPELVDAGLHPDDVPGRPPHLVGRRIVPDAYPAPVLGVGEIAGPLPAVPEIDAAGTKATWSRAVVVPSAADLAATWSALGSAAKRRIETAAEAARMRFLTPGAGKALAYDAKRSEARAFAADQVQDPADYPFAAAEAAVRGLDLAGVVALWAVNIEAWAVRVGPAIEALEQGGKLAVDAAVAVRDLEALTAAEAIDWPSPG